MYVGVEVGVGEKVWVSVKVKEGVEDGVLENVGVEVSVKD